MSGRSIARNHPQDQLQGFSSSSQKMIRCSWTLYTLPEEVLENVELNDLIAANCVHDRCRFLA